MPPSIITLLILVFLSGILCFLYSNGYLSISSKRALVFIGSSFGCNERSGATVKACTGYTKRIVRLNECREYRFVFDYQITKGTVTAELWDSKKQVVLVLDDTNRIGIVTADGKSKYYLVLKYDNAHGNYQLTWS